MDNINEDEKKNTCQTCAKLNGREGGTELAHLKTTQIA
jgi:hypothetical protein